MGKKGAKKRRLAPAPLPLVVLMAPAELMAAACGELTSVRLDDGTMAVVRIPTLQEYRAREAAARARLELAGHRLPPSRPDEDILRILRPLSSEYR